ncbi:MAG: type I-E CRISPR-associated protein Cas7/Cse4/CasC [Acidobacteriota bacterium]|nr:type I-E CRISPR-associated protein Cas7/Cse4/CasC [Acidobacteriota bacterium]
MFIDIHAIQALPSSNINRDDTGSPKSALYGGVRRHRVSSQSWKRAVRETFPSFVSDDFVGIRTKRALELVAKQIAEIDEVMAPSATDLAESVFKKMGLGVEATAKTDDSGQARTKELKTLIFLSKSQVRALAELAIATQGKPGKKEALQTLQSENALDMALFGRMVADAPTLNIDAACQVAHAISTHAVETEFDYFTAVDDYKALTDESDAGAGMIGTVEFVSSCLYRYATINVDQLVNNLESEEDARTSIEAFLKAFVRSMPSGKVNTFANNTLPAGVYVTLREGPMSLVGAFENAVRSDRGEGYVHKSVDSLVNYAQDMYSAYGEPAQQFVLVADKGAESLVQLTDDRYSLSDLATRVATTAIPTGDEE